MAALDPARRGPDLTADLSLAPGERLTTRGHSEQVVDQRPTDPRPPGIRRAGKDLSPPLKLLSGAEEQHELDPMAGGQQRDLFGPPEQVEPPTEPLTSDGPGHALQRIEGGGVEAELQSE